MQEIVLDEATVSQVMWLMMAQYGVIIDDINDDGEVFFTVPNKSEIKAYFDAPLYNVGVGLGDHDVMIAGDLLLQIANGFFEENGLKPHGGIRDQYWTQMMGQFRTCQEEFDMKKEDSKLLLL